MSAAASFEDRLMGRAPDIGDCLCLHSCGDDPSTACSLSGEWHVHPARFPGDDILGPCPLHPDAPGDR